MSEFNHQKSREERRQEIKDKYKQLNADDLIYIPARQQMPVTAETPKKRACAYCRVSTDDPAQTTSYELQKEHYEEEINRNPDWIFAGIYADEGISATSMKHRDNFNRMIAAAEAGKIDVIVTKAVSRFARNVVDCLSMVRHLAALNPPVAVKFETEGINTLDSTSEMILAVMAAAAQEESKTKSNSMNWSLENRFKKGKFLTPVLLGYDHDEDGNLVINQEEAVTVKMIYYMYLAGFPTKEIAEILMQLKRPTKIGNEKWSAATVRSIMQNERYCGNVLSWKTFTYDFWEHKTRKNNQDKPQVLKVDHHEAIISHELYDAAQMKLASERYLRKGIPLPALEVIDEGALKGFVSVNRSWRGFSGNDYMEACESVYQMDPPVNDLDSEKIDVTAGGVLSDEFTLDGYQIVRSQFFSDLSKPTLNISKGKVRFNTVCLKKFQNVEYVELLINSVEKCIAVRPCNPRNPNAIRWGKLKDSKWIVTPRSCSGFAGPLYALMDWKADCGYKISGQYLSDGEEQVLIFDLSDPEVTRFEQVEVENSMSGDPGDDAEGIVNDHCMTADSKAQVNQDGDSEDSDTEFMERRILLFPEDWGRKSESAEHVFLFDQFDDYSENWKIMVPTVIYRHCGNVSAETMQQVCVEAEELLESCRIKIAE